MTTTASENQINFKEIAVFIEKFREFNSSFDFKKLVSYFCYKEQMTEFKKHGTKAERLDSKFVKLCLFYPSFIVNTSNWR